MASLREKKVLARMVRNLGNPDFALEEEIRQEEARLNKPPVVENVDVVSQAAQALSNIKIPTPKTPPIHDQLRMSELDGIRAQIKELSNKMATMGTLSWGGGGTGVVRFADLDDKLSILNRIDFKNYREVTSNAYTITKNDYYVGVNHDGVVTITLPTPPEIPNGYICVVKDESGNASSPTTWIDIYGSGGDLIDGNEYVRLQIDHGSLTFFYRDGWRII